MFCTGCGTQPVDNGLLCGGCGHAQRNTTGNEADSGMKAAVFHVGQENEEAAMPESGWALKAATWRGKIMFGRAPNISTGSSGAGRNAAWSSR